LTPINHGYGTEDCLQHLGLAAQITNITRNQIGAKAHSAYTAAKWRSFNCLQLALFLLNLPLMQLSQQHYFGWQQASLNI
jgi:hypothetical protein